MSLNETLKQRVRGTLLIAFACSIQIAVAGTAAAQSAGTLTTLWSFTGGADGAAPTGRLIQASDGSFYGTTGNIGSGAGRAGTVFKITSSGGALTTLYTFSGGADGLNPYSLVEGTDGNLYGTTATGGTHASGACADSVGSTGCGTVFKLTASGVLTTLYTFSGFADGGAPNGLIQASDGNLYGTTQSGGTSTACPQRCGTLFKISTAGTLTTLYSFTGGSDGALPYGSGTLIEGSDGNLYGTTSAGGTSAACGQASPGCGTVFKATLAGVVTTLHVFAGGADGSYPFGLVQGSDGNVYGTTFDGGTSGNGSIYKITTAGTLTTLYSFTGGADGTSSPGLIQGTDGNFYGTTTGGGSGNCENGGCGTLFSFTLPGTLTTLHTFSGSDGGDPYGLIQGSDENLYGLMGPIGNAAGNGSPQGGVFRFDSSASPSPGGSTTDGASGGGGAIGFSLLAVFGLGAIVRWCRLPLGHFGPG
jgi:uncharacterized repeat protein (TIGR03803 family)